MRTVLLLAGLLLLPSAQAGRAACYDRCDSGALSCGFSASCETSRVDCLRRCDPYPRKPSLSTRQRINQSPEELKKRFAPPSKDRMSSCALRCETSSAACSEANPGASACADGRRSCLDRCGKKKAR